MDHVPQCSIDCIVAFIRRVGARWIKPQRGSRLVEVFELKARHLLIGGGS
jgi:hypothetical protein